MIFLIELILVGAMVAMLAGVVPHVKNWLEGMRSGAAPPTVAGPSRLMARIVQPEPFPSTISTGMALTVMVLTVSEGSFAPEAGAAVSFSVARGNACINGVPSVTVSTDQLGCATVQLMAVRSGPEELIVSVVARGSGMPVAAPIRFETLG